ncbi:MAG: PAC2 family protein [Acidimicrobiales bacterium]|nr:PAC2 family protein [Acidimicrobiales bacterium]
MEHLIWEQEPSRPLRQPILVTAWDGLFDVGGAATGAVEALRREVATRVGHIDPDEFFDFNERRPHVRLDEQGHRRIDWPRNDIYALPLDERDRDLVLMEGVEPHLRWRTFVDAVAAVVERFDVKMVVTLGAMIAETPHTRPPTITGSTTDAALAELMRLDRPSYQGPTGVVGALHEHLDRLGVPAVSLRASVPHYVSGTPNPKASRALLERFERVTGLPTGWAELDEEAREWELRVNEAMEGDDDIIHYVARLEERYDARTASSLPNADDLAAEFERFLRQNDDD